MAFLHGMKLYYSSNLWTSILLLVMLCVYAECYGYAPTNNYVRSRTSNFCDFRVTKQVTCRVLNGSEMYVHRSNAPWCNYQLRTYYPPFSKKECGDSSATYRMMFRPKYVIGYRNIETLERRCCPGFTGRNCDQLCFNCSILEDLQRKVNHLITQGGGSYTSPKYVNHIGGPTRS
ncbi:collagen alpha-1(XXVI) chain-like [Amphiura filiformis]|uniref:collagen alpha-1(XXVI) chain-like n=1 Tax=Amphiura filiformis TaxID=82378 RepID=UPI003B20B971